MKLFVENIFSNRLIKQYSNISQQEHIRNLFMCPGLTMLKELLIDVEENWFSDKDNSTFVVVNIQSGHVFFFLITYLYYLNKAIRKKLVGSFEVDWRDENIGYAVSIEKNLLDKVFGGLKEKVNEILFASGILIKNNDRYRAEVSTYGEDILPAIQHKLSGLNFRLKSYFLVAQIYPAHIQLTLHQVVRISSADTIIVEDEIIQIEDVYDTMCNSIWINMKNNGYVNYCDRHKNQRYTSHHLGSVQAYSKIFENLKSCVLKTVNEINR